MVHAIGIDLGTTNTVIAKDGKVVPMQIDGQTVRRLPSCVAYLPSGKSVIGERARARRMSDPEHTICAAKRIFGKRFASKEVADYRVRYANKIVAAHEGMAAFETRSGLKHPRDVSAEVIETAVRGAGLNPSETSAVITVPAAFSDAQRKDTVWAAMAAGLHDADVLDEPVATALAHGKLTDSKYAVVYDIGGGTFDVCILECTLYPLGVLGHGGDLAIGGEDFDEAIAATIAARMLSQFGWDVRNDRMAFNSLVAKAEEVKIRLSSEQSVEVQLFELDESLPEGAGSLTIDQPLIAEACFALVRRTFQTCAIVLDDSGLSAEDVDRLFLAGGSAEMPLIRAWVVSYFGTEPSREVAPFEAIACGASLAARERYLGG